MTTIYNEADGDPAVLVGKTVGIVGYGDLGRAIALNLRDSGINVLVNVSDTDQSVAAQADGMPMAGTAVIPQRASIIYLLLPDEIMPAVYMQYISPYLKRGDTVLFSSGYNVAFGYIEPPPFVDVGLIAPRAQGSELRERFVLGEGVLSFVGVGQDASRDAWTTVLAVAAAAGLLRCGAVEVSMEQEAHLNLFIQQAIIPIFHHVMTTAANLLMRVGYPAEAALADLYISGKFKHFLQEADDKGLFEAIQNSPLPNQYATLSRLGRFNEPKLERLMEVTLDEIRSSDFAKEWAREYADGYPHLSKMLKIQEDLELWDWEQQTIELLKDRQH